MSDVHKSVLIGFSAAQMYALVDNVERYPEFLPWCGGTVLHERTATTTIATLKIDYHGVKHSFSTVNHNKAPTEICLQLREGPFKALHGRWHFVPLTEDACKIEFSLHYEFSSKLLEKVVGPVFNHIAGTFVDAFIQRAERVYAAI